MGRPLKTKVSETSLDNVTAVVARVAKKLKSFNIETLYGAVVKSFQKTEDATELSSLEAAVAKYLANESGLNSSKYSVANGVYSIVPGKRGRPKKVVEAVASAV